MSDLPAPLVPAEADLRAYDWFPFYFRRLQQSSFWKRASDLACRISVDFWAEAFGQVPAGSLPDDDHYLADKAGFGRRNLEDWLAIKAEIMSAWTLCSDGRWYHPTLAEVACRQWATRLQHAWERECERIRKANSRGANPPLELPPKPADIEKLSAGHLGMSAGQGTASGGRPEDRHERPLKKAQSTGCPADKLECPAENALKEEKEKKEDIYTSPRATPHSKPRKHEYPSDSFASWFAQYPRKQARSDAEKAFRKIEKADDTPFDKLMTGIDRFWIVQPDVKFWPHPATWLNGRRWLDEATAPRAQTPTSTAPRIDFGGGVAWPEPTVREAVVRWRNDPLTWPSDRIGPPPGMPGCLVPDHLLREAA